jgi:hypothetical protein
MKRLSDSAIGCSSHACGLGPDHRVFAVRFIPDGNYVDASICCHHAGPKLSFRLVSKAIANADRVFAQNKIAAHTLYTFTPAIYHDALAGDG